ncbi:tyrosine-type recombinase/integrase [Nocardioides sp. SYSU D00038]|uniref:tyrosine-type recombinase/integrase n=1 Tax=Nocardioides sp. SYSU D00038 TaxID=2812554 RepID=UPI0035B1EE1F
MAPRAEAAGIDPGTDTGMHALRHFYASALLEASVSIKTLSEYLGHHDPAFTPADLHAPDADEQRSRTPRDRRALGATAPKLRSRSLRSYPHGKVPLCRQRSRVSLTSRPSTT